ncbi:MAG: PKD domain-containing protein [Bacteroidota bacterium]
MKKSITIVLLFVALFTSCESRWGRRGDACISADKTTVATEETVTISNCGDEFPTAYVEAEIDWGDGTLTSGQSGNHSYSDDGTYTVMLIINGEEASELLDVEESKVIIDITVQ